MLGDVIAVEAGAVVGLGDGQPVGVELAERHARVVDVVEDAEFHLSTQAINVMPGHSRPRTASLRRYVPGIHALLSKQDVDGRDKPGHDDLRCCTKIGRRSRYFHSILVIS